jgi:hypothetical protein
MSLLFEKNDTIVICEQNLDVDCSRRQTSMVSLPLCCGSLLDETCEYRKVCSMGDIIAKNEADSESA